jgi:ribosomal protein S18 acetylase RimI-like enzyme
MGLQAAFLFAEIQAAGGGYRQREKGPQTLQVRIDIEDQPDLNDQQLIDKGLDVYNFAIAGPDDAQDLWVVARDEFGRLLGGLKGRTVYGWLFIDWLWVSSETRGQGAGQQLLRKAESAAVERQCVGAYVSTFSFQAPEFYCKNGYEEFGRIEGFPVAHACIWLKKTL